MDGVEETAATFEHDVSARRAPQLIGTPFEGLKRFRTFGEFGPMYEVLEVRGDRVRVFLHNSMDETDYRLDHALDDPVAP